MIEYLTIHGHKVVGTVKKVNDYTVMIECPEGDRHLVHKFDLGEGVPPNFDLRASQSRKAMMHQLRRRKGH